MVCGGWSDGHRRGRTGPTWTAEVDWWPTRGCAGELGRERSITRRHPCQQVMSHSGQVCRTCANDRFIGTRRKDATCHSSPLFISTICINSKQNFIFNILLAVWPATYRQIKTAGSGSGNSTAAQATEAAPSCSATAATNLAPSPSPSDRL